MIKKGMTAVKALVTLLFEVLTLNNRSCTKLAKDQKRKLSFHPICTELIMAYTYAIPKVLPFLSRTLL